MGCAALLFLVGMLFSCGKTTAEPTTSPSHREKHVAEDDVCTIPEHPSSLVLGVERHVIPIGEIRYEVGEITLDGRCSPKTECIHTSRETMDRLLVLVRGLGRIRHGEANVSPHYGYRGIKVRWGEEKCEFGDGVVGPIDERDHDRFYAVYDAIAKAITTDPAHREEQP
jgi:hypothetical protein